MLYTQVCPCKYCQSRAEVFIQNHPYTVLANNALSRATGRKTGDVVDSYTVLIKCTDCGWEDFRTGKDEQETLSNALQAWNIAFVVRYDNANKALEKIGNRRQGELTIAEVENIPFLFLREFRDVVNAPEDTKICDLIEHLRSLNGLKCCSWTASIAAK